MLTDEQLAALKPSLFAGHYNLLLGSGSSRDSRGLGDQELLSATLLADKLCVLKGAKKGTALARVMGLLSHDEIEEHLTKPYRNCIPGSTVLLLPNFLWKHIFTFNIDDCLEEAYRKTATRKQGLISINYDQQYETMNDRLQAPVIHLHGYVHEPTKGYVFSRNEYARVTREGNPWMYVLSDMLATEPFIVAGASLDESDLEYYLAKRSSTSGRKNRGPSVFVEPFPDAVTEKDCERLNLLLVKAGLREFLEWLLERLGDPPRAQQLLAPQRRSIFDPVPDNIAQVKFFSSFEVVQQPQAVDASTTPSPFRYGRPPTWSDLAASCDLPTDSEPRIANEARALLARTDPGSKALVVFGDPGTGKTTAVKRVAYDLALEGHTVLSLYRKSRVDLDAAVKCMNAIKGPFLLHVDGIADHTSSLAAIAAARELRRPLLVIGSERNYREDHVRRSLGNIELQAQDIAAWTGTNYEELIERYRKGGLVAAERAVRNPKPYAVGLQRDPVAIAVCRILNDFRPLDDILKSLWDHAQDDRARKSYLITALAEYCHPGGVHYTVLAAAQDNPELDNQLEFADPLPLAYLAEDDDYVVPLNPTMAAKLVELIGRDQPATLLDAFARLANALAPFVNRRAIMEQTPEARLAGRLFDSDKVTVPLLGDLAIKFYEQTKEKWEWNSRYWQQLALLVQETDLDLAIRHAKFALTIETHPFGQTTLAQILTKKLESGASENEKVFGQILALLGKALRGEEDRQRPAPHAYNAMITATRRFLEIGATLQSAQKEVVSKHLKNAQMQFGADPKLIQGAEEILRRL